MSQAGVAGRGSGHAPLILYSPVSWLLVLRMLRAGDALDPTVSTRSKPRYGSCRSGCRFSSCAAAVPVRRAKGLRMGILETDGRRRLRPSNDYDDDGWPSFNVARRELRTAGLCRRWEQEPQVAEYTSLE